jgi:hypothetical protein
LLFRNLKFKIYNIKIFPAVLCGCETCFPALRKEHRLRVLENRVLRRIFGPKMAELSGEGCTIGTFIISTHHQISLDKSKKVG